MSDTTTAEYPIDVLSVVLPDWQAAAELPFVKIEVTREGVANVDLWTLPCCSDPARSAEFLGIGRDCADQVLRFARAHNDQALIGMVFGVLLGRPPCGDFVRAGFIHRIATAAFRGSLN